MWSVEYQEERESYVYSSQLFLHFTPTTNTTNKWRWPIPVFTLHTHISINISWKDDMGFSHVMPYHCHHHQVNTIIHVYTVFLYFCSLKSKLFSFPLKLDKTSLFSKLLWIAVGWKQTFPDSFCTHHIKASSSWSWSVDDGDGVCALSFGKYKAGLLAKKHHRPVIMMSVAVKYVVHSYNMAIILALQLFLFKHTTSLNNKMANFNFPEREKPT